MHPDVIDGNDVGMAEGSRAASLQLKTAEAVRVVRERRFEYLHRDVAPQALVAGTIHFSHPTSAYLFQNSIVTEDLTNHLEGGENVRRNLRPGLRASQPHLPSAVGPPVGDNTGERVSCLTVLWRAWRSGESRLHAWPGGK